MARNKLSFIIIGNNHSDFTPYSVLIRLFHKLAEQKIPCAFKEEGPSDESLSQATQSILRGLRQTQLIKILAPRIERSYTVDKKSSRKYLQKSAWDSIEKLVRSEFMPHLPPSMQNTGTLKNIVLEVFRENAYLEQLKLYETLEQLQVHFAGIEADTKTYTQYITAASGSEDAYYQNESMRINYMVKNIMKDALERFREGGIVFIFTGRNHSHRLAANLLNYVNLNYHDDLDRFDFHAFNLCSSYVKDMGHDHSAALELTAPLDSDEIKEIYKSLPCPMIECVENKGSFSFPELESLVDELIKGFEHVKEPSSPRFFQPSPHDQLIIDIKEQLKQNPDFAPETLITTIETKQDYTAALRYACVSGNSALVKLITRYDGKLPINFNQVSANGKTLLDWFEGSAKSTEEEIEEITVLLKEKMKPSESTAGQSSP